MKKQLLLLTVLFISFQLSYGQCPTSDIVLTTQADINNFAANYPNCSILIHELRVDGTNSNVTNLNGLSAITNAEDIFILGTQISNLFGLDNLESVSHLALWGNSDLQNMTGLSALQSVGDLEIWINSGILTMEGMDNLQSIEGLNLFANSSLNDISQLSFVQVLQELTIGGNALTSLTGLENLQAVFGDVSISNETIANFNELAGLNSIGGSLLLINNPAQDVSAFSNILELVDLYVVECPNLENLTGLENVRTVSGRLRIGLNPQITDLSAFNGISSVGNLDIYENENLQSLAGLENLQQVGERLLIMDNPLLNSIEAIRYIVPGPISELVILNNLNLSVCANPFVCEVVADPLVTKYVANNSNGCNTIPEIEAACLLLSVSDVNLASGIGVYPNPVSEILTISVSDLIAFEKAVIFTVLGQQLFETSEKSIDVSSFTEGVYFVNITTDKGAIVYKIIKE